MDLQQRVERLEKQNRWLKLSIVSVVLLGGIGAIMGAAEGPKEVRARRFVVVDDSGKERGFFGLDPEGKVENVTFLTLESGDKTSSLHMMTGHQQSDFSLKAHNKDNKERVIEARMEANENAQTPKVHLWKYDKIIFEQP